MFEQDADTKDRMFIALLIAAVFVTLLGIRFYANHLKSQQATQAAAIANAAREKSKRVLHLEAITNVYECERDGQRVLTDRPCGTGVPIRVLAPREQGESAEATQ